MCVRAQQGPEWLWPYGHFVRACAHYATPDAPELDESALIAIANGRASPRRVRQLLHAHLAYLRTNADAYAGLPELLNGTCCAECFPVRSQCCVV
jgi:hypothetical protein